jgi:hypothetical protein
MCDTFFGIFDMVPVEAEKVRVVEKPTSLRGLNGRAIVTGLPGMRYGCYTVTGLAQNQNGRRTVMIFCDVCRSTRRFHAENLKRLKYGKCSCRVAAGKKKGRRRKADALDRLARALTQPTTVAN